MFEKIKTKIAEVAHRIDQRLNLSARYGPVPLSADLDLSVRVIGNKVKDFGSRVAESWVAMADNPKEYFKGVVDGSKAKTIGFVNKIREKLIKNTEIKAGFADRLAGWFRNRAEDVYKIPSQIFKLRELWEIEKLKAAVEDKKDNVLAINLLERIEKLNNKRVEYSDKAEKQKAVNEKLRYAYQI